MWLLALIVSLLQTSKGKKVRLCIYLAIVAISAFVDLFGLRNAHAGIVFDTHSFVGVSGMYGRAIQEILDLGGPLLPGFYEAEQGPGSLSVDGYAEVSGTYSVSAKASAAASTIGGQFLRAYAEGFATEGRHVDMAATAEGVAAWRDVAYVRGLQAPAVLRLNFALDGLLITAIQSDSLNSYANVQATLGWTSGLYLTNDLFERRLTENFSQPSGGFGTFSDAIVAIGSYSSGRKWDSLEYTSSGYRGTFHIDVNFDQAVGGYIWGLGLSTYAEARGALAISNASHTLSLQSTTLPDGTRVDATFESGLSAVPMAAVPEPSSMAILLGMIPIVAMQHVRRRLTQSPGAIQRDRNFG